MNHRIAQLVDSAGNIPRPLLGSLNITEVPFYYTFDRCRTYRENRQLTSDQFYQTMKDRPQQVPVTSAPNVQDWLNSMEQMYSNGFREFLVTTISQRLSASYQNAVLAQRQFLDQHRNARVEVINSNSCACGQAALEIRIGQLIHEHRLAWEEVLERVKTLLPTVTTLFTVESLDYMKAGGRIGGAAAFLGKLISIKPVCEFVDGVVHPIRATRCRKKSLQALVDVISERMKEKSLAVVCTQHAISAEDDEWMVDYLHRRLVNPIQLHRGPLGATVGAHSGPGAIGIGCVIDS